MSAGFIGRYMVAYPIEEMRMIWCGGVAFRLNVPSSPLIVPVTKAESGSDSSTTLAYGIGLFSSSTNFPLTVCAKSPVIMPWQANISNAILSAFISW